MSKTALHAVIEEYGKELKIPTMVRLYQELARNARDEEWSYEEYFKQLCESENAGAPEELRGRNESGKPVSPDRKTLDQIDWQALRGVSKPKILELASCEYIEQG